MDGYIIDKIQPPEKGERFEVSRQGLQTGAKDLLRPYQPKGNATQGEAEGKRR